LLGHRQVSVLKLDVEGHELAVLRGAGRALCDGAIRHIVFEEHAGPMAPSCRCLSARGFTVLKIDWATRGPLLAPLSAAMQRLHEAPSYLATLDAPTALARCDGRGWQCLRRRGRS
jgi:hypothetical protein